MQELKRMAQVWAFTLLACRVAVTTSIVVPAIALTFSEGGSVTVQWSKGAQHGE